MIERGAAVAVIGGGLAGLTAAYRLQQANFKTTLFEAGDGVGGRVQTLARDGYLIDTGASALADSYESYLSLAQELGLGDQVVPAQQTVGVYRKGRLYELRLDQLYRSGLRTRLISAGGKIRLLRIVWDIAWAKQRGQLGYGHMQHATSLDTESAGHYAFRVAGREVADYIASPIVRTMLIADANQISKVELFSGVVNIFTARVMALLGGQNRLPRLLGEGLTPRLRHTVERVHRVGRGVDVEFLDPAGKPHNEHFTACVIGCPLPEALRICEDHGALLAPLHAGLKYSQCIAVAFGFRSRPLSDAFLVQIPNCEDPDVALLFLDHNKASDRAPPGCGLVSCYWEAAAATRMMDHPDEEITARTLNCILKVFPELHGKVVFSHVTRWRLALPFTSVGSYRRIQEFNSAVDPSALIQFAGDYMSAAGQDSAVESGNRAAANLRNCTLGAPGYAGP